MLRNIKQFSLPELEERVLEFWRTNHVFQVLEKARKDRKRFIFFEGPPTANGQPGIHHVLSRAFKDIILRYQTMRGKYVLRRAGWDTHGLPVELEVEKKLGLNSKKDIETYGIAAFNAKCRESVWEYQDEWERLTERMGFWLDMEHPYITYENSYLESVWWILKELWRKKLLYRGYKVVPWCPRCGTALSSHELAQGYAETTDDSVYVKFKVVGRDNTYLVSWTTTPWTLPGNVALAVGEAMEYAETERNGERLIYATGTPFAGQFKGAPERRLKGKELVNLSYEPLFDVPALREDKKAYHVYAAPFVTTEDGTGIVHTAVMYGADDYELGVKVGLPQYHLVLPDGTFNGDVPGLQGMFVKSKETEEKIIAHLKERGALLKEEPYRHEYPFCWRCDTPVIYYARDSWFIAMSGLQNKLLKTNERISWMPASTGSGRFAEWLKGAKDWALSRERYWGTPLPVWECSSCGKREIVGSFAELSERVGGARNEYVLMRHAEAEHNVHGLASTDKSADRYLLTEQGRIEARAAGKELKKKHLTPDLIIASDFLRTKETAELVGTEVGAEVVLDERLREIRLTGMEGELLASYHAHFRNERERFSRKVRDGDETLRDVAVRVNELFQELEEKHRGKRILLVTHEDVAWMLEAVLAGWSEEQAASEKERRGYMYRTGELRAAQALSLPHGQYGLADFHRPFIDEVRFDCTCGGTMRRVPEVIDVWFDSGAMPYAQWHYPFEHAALIDKREQFPADYISEAVDQTRGWFYTLLAVSVALGRGEPYRHVISLGHVLDTYGRKMSKTRGNAVRPQEAFQKFGVDAIRWYFYTVNPAGEPKRFDEQEITKVLRGPIMLLYNSFVFWNTYPAKRANTAPSPHVLDRWILSRCGATVAAATEALEAYDIGAAARATQDLIDDLSRWYIRRARPRFQRPASEADHACASATLCEALLITSRLIAPFMPFLAEGLYQSLGGRAERQLSVHLEDWPKHGKVDASLLEDMARARALAQAGLSRREAAGIKIRQPLASLTAKDAALAGKDEFLNIVKDEVNVRRILFDEALQEDVVLDTALTNELRDEGMLRELVRSIQDLRKDSGCEPGDTIRVSVESDAPDVERVVRNFGQELERNGSAVLAAALAHADGEKTIHLLDGDVTVVKIEKR